MATPLTEEQKSKYESAAKKYRDNNFIEGTPLHSYSPIIFMRGTEHAHPIGFNLGKEEGKVEGWNDALDDIQTRLMTEYRRLSPELIYDELQKLRK